MGFALETDDGTDLHSPVGGVDVVIVRKKGEPGRGSDSIRITHIALITNQHLHQRSAHAKVLIESVIAGQCRRSGKVIVPLQIGRIGPGSGVACESRESPTLTAYLLVEYPDCNPKVAVVIVPPTLIAETGLACG